MKATEFFTDVLWKKSRKNTAQAEYDYNSYILEGWKLEGTTFFPSLKAHLVSNKNINRTMLDQSEASYLVLYSVPDSF